MHARGALEGAVWVAVHRVAVTQHEAYAFQKHHKEYAVSVTDVGGIVTSTVLTANAGPAAAASVFVIGTPLS